MITVSRKYSLIEDWTKYGLCFFNTVCFAREQVWKLGQKHSIENVMQHKVGPQNIIFISFLFSACNNFEVYKTYKKNSTSKNITESYWKYQWYNYVDILMLTWDIWYMLIEYIWYMLIMHIMYDIYCDVWYMLILHVMYDICRIYPWYIIYISIS